MKIWLLAAVLVLVKVAALRDHSPVSQTNVSVKSSESRQFGESQSRRQADSGKLVAAWQANKQHRRAANSILNSNSSAPVPLLLSTLASVNAVGGGNVRKPRPQPSTNQQQQLLANINSQTTTSTIDPLELLATDFPNPNLHNAGHEIIKILKKFFSHGYDKRVRPNYSGPPALVNVSFHIIGISSVSEVQMDFTTDFYFRQKWFDPRLEFAPVGDINELCVGAEFADKIWLPDTFFANEKTATFHKATTENTFIRVGSNGRVYRSIRLTVTCSCPMDLQYFPMDRQRCKIEIESYGYNTRDINYRWEKDNASVSLDGKIELPQFKVLGFRMGHELQSLSSGDYIRLYCEIHFVRSMGYYLIQIYIPASLIVIISWVSFWLHRNATPARVALGVTTVLTMTTLMSSTNAALPKISYIKSIDVFLGTCFVMVFASLLEYASVGYIGKRIAMKRERQSELKSLQLQHSKICLAAAAANRLGSNGGVPGGVPANNTNKAALRQHSSVVSASGGKMNTSTIQASIGTPTANWRQVHATPNFESAQQPKPLNAGKQTAVVSSKKRLSVGRDTPSAGNQTKDKLSAQANGSGSQKKERQISILGVTPSAIDKYSRVVFPICFVCFNLMYWIIYAHISQQIDDDKGAPLIPFVKS